MHWVRAQGVWASFEPTMSTSNTIVNNHCDFSPFQGSRNQGYVAQDKQVAQLLVIAFVQPSSAVEVNRPMLFLSTLETLRRQRLCGHFFFPSTAGVMYDLASSVFPETARFV